MRKNWKNSRHVLAVVLVAVVAVLFWKGNDWRAFFPPKLERFEREFFDLFDTASRITGYEKNRQEFEENAQWIYDRLAHYASLYDIYKDYPNLVNLKTVNDMAGKEPVAVAPEIIRLLQLGKQMHQKSDGRLNIALGPVLKKWHDARQEGAENPKAAKIPSMQELTEVNHFTDINKLVIDEAEGTVYLTEPQMRLDVGALGKGYAVEMVAREMQERGITGYLLNIGGNVRAVGQKLGEKPWKAGVQNPNTKSDQPYLEVVDLNDTALVTSGGYQRFYVVDGKEYHHIINPDTLMPADYFLSVSVVGLDEGKEDAHSTIAFNLPLQESIRYIESIPTIEAIWVLKNGEIVKSFGFDRYRSTK